MSTENQTPNSQKLSWNITDFFKQSIQLLKRNPKLLLLSVVFLVLAGSSSSSSNFNSGGSSSSSDKDNDSEINEVILDDQEEEFETLTEDELISTVNTDFTNEFNSSTELFREMGIESDPEVINNLYSKSSIVLNNIGKAFTNGVKRLSPWMKISFPIEIVLLGIALILFSYLVGIWARVAMMYGTHQAATIDNNNWKLSTVTKESSKRIKPMVWMLIIPTLKIFLWMMAFFGGVGIFISGIALTFDKKIYGLLFIGLGIALFIFSLKKVIRTTVAQILGYWTIALRDLQPAKESYNQAFELAGNKGTAGKLFGLGFVHFIIFGLLLPLIALVPVGSFLYSFIKNIWQTVSNTSDPGQINQIILESLTPVAIFGVIITTILTSILLLALQLVSTPIKHANWYWAYQYLVENNKSKNIDN